MGRATRSVAIVGRPNVGKSAIFNRLAGRRISIVHDQPGVTRDRISAPGEVKGIPYTLIDTGGIGDTLEDGFDSQVQTEAEIAVESADLILFVVDVMDGITAIDETLAGLLRKAETPIVLVINKVDTDARSAGEYDFARLGFEEQCLTSAEHGRGFRDLEDKILAHLKASGATAASEDGEEDEGKDAPEIKVAIVGRPNVGKSSLVNAILDDARTIVSDVAGTTRDAVDVPYERNGKPFLLIDTAGLRKRTKMDTSVEVFSAMRSERSIRRADICALVIDASTGVTSQDRKIASTILAAHKPCIIVLNKFDLVEGTSKAERLEQLKEEIKTNLFFLHYAPVAIVSALQGHYLKKLFQSIESVRKSSQHHMNTGTLNRLFKAAMEKNPPPQKRKKGNKRFHLLYVTHAKDDRDRPIPVPHFVMFANRGALLDDTCVRYLENQIRDHHPYRGLPIQLTVRGKGSK